MFSGENEYNKRVQEFFVHGENTENGRTSIPPEEDMVEIVEVKTNRQKKLFADFPMKLYKDCPYYVPPLYSEEKNILNPEKNFNLQNCDCRCFLAYKDGKLVGRIAGIIHNRANAIWNEKNIRFSRFEAIDDLEVFEALLGAVEQYGRERGMDTLHGPWGFNDTDREGMLTYGFSERSTYGTNYYYPYFCENMKKLGFEDESKWVERNFTVPDQPYERVMRIASKIKTRLKVFDAAEKLPMKKIVKKYGDAFFETYNESYSEVDGFTPIGKKQQKNVLKQFATVINTRYFSCLINEKGECAGFAVVLPSICEALRKSKGRLFPFGWVGVLRSIKHPTELEMALIGIKKEYKFSGINSVLMARMMCNIVEDDIKKIESNPMLESNLSIQLNWKFAENEIVKRRQTFKRPIEKK